MQNLNMGGHLLNETSRKSQQKQYEEEPLVQSEVDKNTDVVRSDDSLMFKLK